MLLSKIMHLGARNLSRKTEQLRVSGTKTEQRAGSKLVKAPSNFIIAGRPKAALLFLFFGDFRCGVLLFMVILVLYTCV